MTQVWWHSIEIGVEGEFSLKYLCSDEQGVVFRRVVESRNNLEKVEDFYSNKQGKALERAGILPERAFCRLVRQKELAQTRKILSSVRDTQSYGIYYFYMALILLYYLSQINPLFNGAKDILFFNFEK